MSRSDSATVLKINSVCAFGPQVAPGRVVVAHCAEDHEQLAHAGSERSNTRVGQAPATDVVTTGREMLAAHGRHRLRSPHARPSQRRAPFPPFRLCCVPSVIPVIPPPRHSCVPSVIPAEAGIQAICAGQGHSQCSTAPDHPRGSGGPSAGWRLVARLGGRMDSCLRRNDGQGGCDGGGGGMTEARAPSVTPDPLSPR